MIRWYHIALLVVVVFCLAFLASLAWGCQGSKEVASTLEVGVAQSQYKGRGDLSGGDSTSVFASVRPLRRASGAVVRQPRLHRRTLRPARRRWIAGRAEGQREAAQTEGPRLVKAIAALLLLCPACMLTPEGERVPDWNTWDAELEDVQADIDAILPLYPEHADTLLELRGHAENAEQVVEALAEGTGEFEGSDAVAYIRAGLVTAEALVPIFLEDDPERAERVRFYIAVFRIVLRRVERYALE